MAGGRGANGRFRRLGLLVRRLISDGTLPDGYAGDDGTGLIFEGTQLTDCVSETEGAGTWQLSRRPDGSVSEVPLPTRLLLPAPE
jgi:hypothetical protein